jgi:non-ribosomal peptide synthetase component F
MLKNVALSITQQLSELNLAKETAVGVYLPRNRFIPASLLGIMAADCAYLPLDPKHPQARTELLLEIAQAKYVITTMELASRLPSSITPVFIDENVRPDEATLQRNAGNAAQLAYFIFTSGSTGVPKGVMIEHGNVLALMRWAHQTIPANNCRKSLAVHRLLSISPSLRFLHRLPRVGVYICWQTP